MPLITISFLNILAIKATTNIATIEIAKIEETVIVSFKH